MNKIISILILISSISVEAKESGCGTVLRGSQHAQLIPLEGSIKTKLKKDDLISCGSMLITNEEPVWMELSDLTHFKVAPNSFFEFSVKGKFKHQLHRGEVMVTAPSSIHPFELTTPNSVSVFNGGVMLVRYVAKSKETTLASFNRKITFKNKFHLEASQVVNTGEMSRLWINESRIVPSQPELMNPSSVKDAFSGFDLPPEELKELAEVSKKIIESREKTMIADLEGWEDIEKESSDEQARSIASVKGKKVESSIDTKEAENSLNLMKKHLYGDEDDLRMFNESRNPASQQGREKFKDAQYQRKKAKEQMQMKKVMDQIRNFESENE